MHRLWSHRVAHRWPDKVMIWYAEDDEEVPPTHPKWMIEHFNASSRAITGYKHMGAVEVVDYDKFLEQLVADPKDGDEEKTV